ncbi:plectin [Octopus sinensis]|uniref:Plectin n=1 Tax=Octopus sinensis TaxID=2607531 RepID=A0A7E6F5C4_9MOLL|nr:plectin [Octopus sinensis]
MKSIESKLIQEDDGSLMSPASMSKVKECSEWAEKRQDMVGGTPFGTNNACVHEAMENMRSRCKDIRKEESQYRDFLNSQDSKIAEIREATRAFDSLDALMAKQTACLEVISQITTLEDTVQNTALAIDTKSVHLVNSGVQNHVQEAPNYGNNCRLMAAAKNCNLAVRNNWRWIGQMLQCAQVHFHKAADFHQFFHDAQEAEYWMKNTLSTVHLSFDRSKLQGDMADVQSIKDEIKEVLLAYTQWQGKIDSLFDRAKNIVPVSQRLKPIEEPCVITALADYRTSDIEFTEGESLTLLNNSDKKIWKVSNTRGQTALVPAVLLLIPGPYPEALDVAIKMRVQLLALWTASVKRLGYQLIAFMLLVVKDYSEDEIQQFTRLSSSQQKELICLLKYIEETLMPNWNGYKDFGELQERMARIRFILEEKNGTVKSISDGSQQSVVIQFNALKDLLGKYGDFWAYWETYKVIVELLKQPKFVLVCDKWEQLRFVTTAHFVRFWDTNLDVDTVGKVDQIEQTVVNKSLALHETPREDMISSDYTVSTEKEETETEQVVTSIEEEERTFFIKDVVDPLSNNLISFQEAIVRGIIDQTNARYVNPYTRESMPIREAMNSGLVKLEWTTRNKIREEKRSFGLITIKTTRDSRPYNIMQVVDPSTNKPIPTSDAVKKGILDIKNSVYVKGPDDTIPIPEAIDMGKVIIEYTGSKDAKPEVVTKTYAVHSIVDQKKKDRVPFAEAITQGLFDKQNGIYIHNVSGARIPVGEAIAQGFIKARLVTDPSKLDINPENTVVIERVQNVRDKITKGLKVVNAMKAAMK